MIIKGGKIIFTMLPLIQFTDKGLYCAPGDFYIDPWKPVMRAVITHAHSDHARWGHQYYLCHSFSKPLLQLRLGHSIAIQTAEYGEVINHHGVKISLHPAGHIIGSAQVRLEYQGNIWVVSGDYKLQHDGISTPFEVVPCQVFITESTFGLPIYQWQPQNLLFNDIRQWIKNNQAAGKNSIILAYSLGKAQRIIHWLKNDIPRFFVHGAIETIHQTLIQHGWPFTIAEKITDNTAKQELQSGLIIAPPSAGGSMWLKRFYPYSLGICSGWMQVRGNIRRSNADRGFALSDHADWTGLMQAVQATGAEKIYVTHGFSSAFTKYLNEKGLAASEIVTEYGNEDN